jgi:hypothetical protein
MRRLHAIANLATDALEALVHMFNSDRAADQLWLRTTTNPMGRLSTYEWSCPCCGKWINKGDGKFTNDDFIVHSWCS